MSLNRGRIWAITKKELRDYRRNRFIVGTMVIMPVLFSTLPTIEILALSPAASTHTVNVVVGLAMLYLLLIPAIVPSTLSAHSVVGEREQGTLEPVLITPIRREEFLLGKALAALVPTVAVSYVMFGVFLILTATIANPIVASDVFTAKHLLIQFLFSPLLAGWSIWVGIAISSRSSDIRVAQQLGTLASLPPLALAVLISSNVIPGTLGVALAVAAGLLLIDGLGWRVISALFDRERLITGQSSG
ncbi:MAG: ABC transporter permease subunit [Acidimicrobiaceae bacterium]|nr:ABC transporter permease subunit [Acidimicrobiaceae bacterium]MBO0747463.1 ABC transporter permease subunit [Acidimicrobiaceae bacterium]